MVKKYRIIWDDDAKASLRKVYDYIAKDSFQSARKVRSGIVRKARSLKTFPFRFAVERLLEDQSKEYRSVLIWDYKIIYRVAGDTVRILDVFHTSRNPEELKSVIGK